MILAVDISIDEVINTAISFDLNLVDCLNVPLSQNQKLVKLLCEVLDSQLDGNFNREVGGNLGIQLLEVLTLA